MFKFLKISKRRADAAMIIQNLLELPMQFGRFEGASRGTANKLVNNIAKVKPEIVNGSRGVIPHKLAYAAAALSNHMNVVRVNQGTTDLLMGFYMALSPLLIEASENGMLYPFSELDLHLLNEANETLFAVQSELKSELGPAYVEMNQLLHPPRG